MGSKFLESFKVCLAFPERWFCSCQPILAQKIQFKRLLIDFKINLWETPIQGVGFWRVLRFVSLSQKNVFVFVERIQHYKALNQYPITRKIRFKLLTDFKTNLQETPRQRASFWRVSRLDSISQKNGFVFADQYQHCKALNQFSITEKIQFRLLTDFKTNLQEALMKPESFCRYPRFVSLSQKNGFVFVNQIWHYKALNQSSMAQKIWFGLLTELKTSLQEIPTKGESFLEIIKVCLAFPKIFFCIR